MIKDIDEILSFLPCKTPNSWVEWALAHPETMLIDHAHCEKKAASSAIAMIYRYPDRPDLLQRMSKLAREELRHFEQVLKIMQKRGIAYTHLSPARYAGELHQLIASQEPDRLVDSLIVGAFIEARSCERFACIAPLLDDELCKFYQGLLASEARHYQVYLALAEQYAPDGFDINARVNDFAAKEKMLIESTDTEFRFHSGVK